MTRMGVDTEQRRHASANHLSVVSVARAMRSSTDVSHTTVGVHDERSSKLSSPSSKSFIPKTETNFASSSQTFWNLSTFTADQVAAITDPKTKRPKDYPDIDSHPGPGNGGLDSYAVSERQLREYEKTHPDPKRSSVTRIRRTKRTRSRE